MSPAKRSQLEIGARSLDAVATVGTHGGNPRGTCFSQKPGSAMPSG